jgi:hypothetical protein
MLSRSSELYLIQGSYYSGIHSSPLCANTNNFANAFDFHPITEFGTVYSVEAMTIKENK